MERCSATQLLLMLPSSTAEVRFRVVAYKTPMTPIVTVARLAIHTIVMIKNLPEATAGSAELN